MGDTRRFHLFAKLINKHIPLEYNIADIAGGKGYLQLALRELGYKKIVSWNKRHKENKKNTIRYQLFDYKKAIEEDINYDAIVAMHPDEGTDHSIMYASLKKIKAIICPCCIKPSAVTYWGKDGSFNKWIDHLEKLATKRGMTVQYTQLRMTGKNIVMIINPK